MEKHEHARPTGRRRITARMIAVSAAHPAEWEPATRGKALGALKRAAPALGVPRRVVDLVDYLVGCTQEVDWSPGARPMAWPSNATLGDALALGRSQVKALVRLALEYGLVELDESSNGQRRGRREGGRTGPIIEAWGFDLTPLAARRTEFEQVAAAHSERRREGRKLRGRVTALCGKVLGLADAGAEQGTPGADWPALAAEARALAALRGDSEDPTRLVPLVERLSALHARAKEVLAAAAVRPSGPVKTDPMGPESRPHLYTPTTLLPIAKATTAAAGPGRPKAHEDRSSRDRPSQRESGKPSVSPESARPPMPSSGGSALRGFVVTTDWLVQVAPAFRGWVGSACPSWGELAEAAGYVRAELEIGKHAWGQACLLLGRMEAIATLAVIATRHARGEVGSPERLLRKMVELHQAGTLRLDKSLFGLMERPRQDRRREEKPGVGRRRRS